MHDICNQYNGMYIVYIVYDYVRAMRADEFAPLYSRLNGCQENESPVAFSWLLVSCLLAVLPR